MAETKTRVIDESVEAFLAAIEDDDRQRDCFELLRLMEEITGEPARLWGSSMVGFGSYHYRYASGHEGDSFLAGFAPRKRNLTIYLGCEADEFEEDLALLGKHKIGKGCLHLKDLASVDSEVLRRLVRRAAETLRARYP